MAKTCKACAAKRRKAKIGALRGPSDQSLQTAGLAIAGGIIGNLVQTKVLTKIAFLQSNPLIGTVVVAGVGIGLMELSDNKMLQDLGLGMAIVGGTKAVGQVIPAIGAPMQPGYSPYATINALAPAMYDPSVNGIQGAEYGNPVRQAAVEAA